MPVSFESLYLNALTMFIDSTCKQIIARFIGRTGRPGVPELSESVTQMERIKMLTIVLQRKYNVFKSNKTFALIKQY